MIWILIFNCFGNARPSNLVEQLDKNYTTEKACLIDAKKGFKDTNTEGCYFACIKGFRKE